MAKPKKPNKKATADASTASKGRRTVAAAKESGALPDRAKKPGQLRSAELKKEIELVRRRNKILDLKENGASIRQIAEHLAQERLRELRAEFPHMPPDVAEFEAKKGLSPSRVHDLLVEALEDLYKTQRMKTRHYVQLELNKIDRAELAHFSKLLQATGADEIEKLSRAMERYWRRRDSLLGLHKPQEVKIDAREALAKLLGRKPEELPDGDDDA